MFTPYPLSPFPKALCVVTSAHLMPGRLSCPFTRTDLNFGGAPAPGEGVQQRYTAEVHIVSLITTAKRGEVTVIGQRHSTVAKAGTGCLSLHL